MKIIKPRTPFKSKQRLYAVMLKRSKVIATDEKECADAYHEGFNRNDWCVARDQIWREDEHLDEPTPRVFLWTKQGSKTYKKVVVKMNKCCPQICKIVMSDFFAGHKHTM